MFFLPLADTPFIPVHRTGFSAAILIEVKKEVGRKTPSIFSSR